MALKVIPKKILFDSVAQNIAQGQEVQVPTKGNSMLPFIVGGKDQLILEPIAALSVGDIVLANIDNSNYVVHRIISIEQDRITLMGDGNLVGTEQCQADQVVAKVKFIIHKGKLVDCNSPKQRRRAALWQRLLPLRRYILAIWRRVV